MKDVLINLKYVSASDQTVTVTNDDPINGIKAVLIDHEGEDTHTLYLNSNQEVDNLIEMLKRIKE